MKMRKIMWAVCLAALMPISAEAVAATSYDEPHKKKILRKKKYLTLRKRHAGVPMKWIRYSILPRSNIRRFTSLI